MNLAREGGKGKGNYPKKKEDGSNGRHVDDQNLRLGQAGCLLATIQKQAADPFTRDALVALDRLDRVVLEDEDNGEEDNVADNNEHNCNSSPLQLDDASDAPVGLLRGHGADAVGVRGEARALGRSAVISERSEVNFDAIPKCGELDDDGQACKDKQRNPEIRKTVLVVNVAGGSEPERHSTEDDSADHTNDGNTPAGSLREPHKVATNDDLPADLQVERQGAQKNPQHTRPSSQDEKAA